MREILKTKFGELTFSYRKDFHDIHILTDELKRNCYHIPKNPKVVIDIGAHIGGTTILCASKGATVYAFEPEHHNHVLLVENVMQNKFSGNVRISKMGIGKAGDNRKFYLNDHNSGTVGLEYQKDWKMSEDNYTTIHTVPLKWVFDTYEIEYCDLLKLDCEGAEYEIFNELPEEYFDRIGQISLEMHYTGLHDKLRYDNLLALFNKHFDIEKTSRHEYICTRKKGGAK